jgi:hypothetical protein
MEFFSISIPLWAVFYDPAASVRCAVLCVAYRVRSFRSIFVDSTERAIAVSLENRIKKEGVLLFLFLFYIIHCVCRHGDVVDIGDEFF